METFVLRLWTPADDDEPRSELRGVLDHRGFVHPQPFKNETELLALLRLALTERHTRPRLRR